MKTQSFIAGLVAILAIFGLFAADRLGADDNLCAKGYSKAHRLDKETAIYLKQEVFRRDARSLSCFGPCSPKDFELNHVVPLSLGGSNALDNLELEHWSEAELRDEIEKQVKHAYCAGKVKGGLPAAQEFFRSGDWRDGYLLQELMLP